MASNPITSINPRLWDGLEPGFANGRFTLTARCSETGCAVERVWTTRTVFDPTVAVGRARTAGWKTGKVKCPDHSRTVRKLKETTEMATKPANTNVADFRPPAKPVQTADQVLTAAASSGAARKAKLDAIDWLREGFNVETGLYVKGMSDEVIAKDVGLSAVAVAAIREDLFGPLGVPDELTLLQSNLDELRKGLAMVEREAQIHFDHLKEGIAAVEAKLVAACKANGWKQ